METAPGAPPTTTHNHAASDSARAAFLLPIPLTHHSALKQAPPFGIHRGWVAEKLLVNGLSKAGVGGLEDVRIHWSHPDEGIWQG